MSTELNLLFGVKFKWVPPGDQKSTSIKKIKIRLENFPRKVFSLNSGCYGLTSYPPTSVFRNFFLRWIT